MMPPRPPSKSQRNVRQTFLYLLIKVLQENCFSLPPSKSVTDGAFQQYNKFDDKLADRLRSVRVTSKDEEVPEEKERDSRMPSDRIGMAMPYVFRRPEVIPTGKITVFDALDMLLSKQKEGASVAQMASTYSLRVEDVEKIVQYVDVFRATKKGLPTTDVKYLADKMTEDSDMADTYDAKLDLKKRALKSQERSAADTEASKDDHQPQQQQQLNEPSEDKQPTKLASKVESK